MVMKRCRWSSGLLGSVLVLTGCMDTSPQTQADWQAVRYGQDALSYRKRCVEAIERRRAQINHPQGHLPTALDGETCQSAALREFALDDTQTGKVEASVIELDRSRLSGYTLGITGKDGETYTYVDRGIAEAEAEQAGTFESAAQAGLVTTEPAEPGTPEPQLTDKTE